MQSDGQMISWVQPDGAFFFPCRFGIRPVMAEKEVIKDRPRHVQHTN